MQLRLDKYLADLSVDTRSKVKLLIRKGRVRVNNEIAKKPETKIDTETDTVTVDGRKLVYHPFEYYMLNKPRGVISASRDNRKNSQVCVTDLIREKIRSDLFPVGRLDKDTEGLLIITNDGELAHRLLSPKKHVDKTYYAELDGRLMRESADRIMAGVDIGDEKPTLPCLINILSENSCLVTIREGRYHEIKRMFRTEVRKVDYLKRISMGPISLDAELAPGEYRRLTEEEIAVLKVFDRKM